MDLNYMFNIINGIDFDSGSPLTIKIKLTSKSALN